jgi:hypothetical protein
MVNDQDNQINAQGTMRSALQFKAYTSSTRKWLCYGNKDMVTSCGTYSRCPNKSQARNDQMLPKLTYENAVCGHLLASGQLLVPER